jgi:hypothetical protein
VFVLSLFSSPSLFLIYSFIYIYFFGRLHVIPTCGLDSGSQENGKVSLPEADKSRLVPLSKVTTRQTRLANLPCVRKLPNYA